MMWRIKGGFILLMCLVVFIGHPKAASGSVIATLDNLKEVNKALIHAQDSLNDLYDLVENRTETTSPDPTPTSLKPTSETTSNPTAETTLYTSETPSETTASSSVPTSDITALTSKTTPETTSFSSDSTKRTTALTTLSTTKSTTPQSTTETSTVTPESTETSTVTPESTETETTSIPSEPSTQPTITTSNTTPQTSPATTVPISELPGTTLDPSPPDTVQRNHNIMYAIRLAIEKSKGFTTLHKTERYPRREVFRNLLYFLNKDDNLDAKALVLVNNIDMLAGLRNIHDRSNEKSINREESIFTGSKNTTPSSGIPTGKSESTKTPDTTPSETTASSSVPTSDTTALTSKTIPETTSFSSDSTSGTAAFSSVSTKRTTALTTLSTAKSTTPQSTTTSVTTDETTISSEITTRVSETTQTEDTTESTKEMTSTSAHTTSTSTGTTTTTIPVPWRNRVLSVLETMTEVTKMISDGKADHEHAYEMDQLATSLEGLVDEGCQIDPGLLDVNATDLNYINSIREQVDITEKDIRKQIDNAEGDKKEMIITLVMLSLLFVVVLVALIIAFIRPWAGGCRLPKSKAKHTSQRSSVALDDNQFNNSSFQDRSHMISLQETNASEGASA